MYIEASAPTRIDLAGGTLDIWPLYLFHEGSQTLNAAISLRARCSIASRTDRRIVIVSGDTGLRVEAEHWSDLRDNHELRLLGRILHYFQAQGLELHTRCESPVGAGIAGSSALNIAVCGALARWSGRTLSADAIMQIAMNVEAQAIDVPTGVQDYRPAQRHIDGDATVQASFARIRDIAAAMRTALEAADWPEVGRHVADEWENRKRLAPGVTTPEIDTMLAAARAAGAHGGKVCGAGGGGCLFCIGDSADIPAIRRALAAAGARILDFQVERDGLKIEPRDAAAAR